MSRGEYDDAKTRLERYHAAFDLVQKQAEDDALWLLEVSITEAYLQQELRRLHAVIEGKETTVTQESVQ